MTPSRPTPAELATWIQAHPDLYITLSGDDGMLQFDFGIAMEDISDDDERTLQTLASLLTTFAEAQGWDLESPFEAFAEPDPHTGSLAGNITWYTIANGTSEIQRSEDFVLPLG